MTREIKFRAKRIDTGEWVYGDYFKTPLTIGNTEIDPKDGWHFLSGETRHCIRCGDGVAYIVDQKTVGQFTGLRDKNGIDIYEGDIVEDHVETRSHPEGITSKVVIKWNNNMTLDDSYGKLAVGFDMHRGTLRVIGNIHDNPELL